MIKANELRIGNYLLDEFKDARRIIELRTDAIQFHYDIVDSYDKCEGIPLTLEILEKCGFEVEQSNDDEERTIYSKQVANNTSLYFDPHKDWMRGNQDVEWYLSHEWNNNHFKNDFWNNPKYLHQLQNLYFALSGEELVINPPLS